ncbi:hypothetical protein BDV93DRAFT_517988 [Ceratobasidium sp. AG-I]|nr:hypothetical protein BDV93DRAFT_517988 [Ceratobasidium sp. AG-I]
MATITPLAPHTISLALQYLLPPSELPTHLVARSLLQRHHFLSITPSDPAAYLCWPHPNADPEKAIAALDQLATQDHEQLIQSVEVRYQPASVESDPVRALVWLGDRVQLVFVWEEDQDGAGWRYLDADYRPLPQNCSSTLTPTPALQVTPAPQEESEPSADDYWAGYDSGSSPHSPRMPSRTLDTSAADEEDAYWASYGTVQGSGDSTVPSPMPAKSKPLDAWGREELPWDEHAEPDAQAWDADTAPRHGLGVTILSNSRPPTPPSMPTHTLTLTTQAPTLPGLDHRNWNSPPSSLSAPFSALSEPDDAPLDEEHVPEAESPAPGPDASSPAPEPALATETTKTTPSPADAGLTGAVKGMYAVWLASRTDTGATPEESRRAFMALVGGALADS